MKCKRCNNDYESIMIYLVDAEKTQCFCPNCLTLSYFDNQLNLKNDFKMLDDITGEPGAVKFESDGEVYFLEKNRMERLITYNLMPYEYLKLMEKYGNHCYMIHEDFYTEDGYAIQPID